MAADEDAAAYHRDEAFSAFRSLNSLRFAITEGRRDKIRHARVKWLAGRDGEGAGRACRSPKWLGISDARTAMCGSERSASASVVRK